MQGRQAAHEPRRVRVVSPGLRRRRPLSNAPLKDILHTQSFTHLLDYNEEGGDDDVLGLQRNTLSGADPSLNILSIDAALSRAVLGSDALCADLCTTTTMRHDIPALSSSSRRNKSRLPATRRFTHSATQDVLTGDDEGGIHTIAAAEQGKQSVITVPLSPVPQKAAATNVGQIVSSILDPPVERNAEGNSDEATLVDDEADIATGLDALRERLAQARERLESHMDHYHNYYNSPQVTREGDKITRAGHTSNTKKKKAMRHSVSSTSSFNSHTNTAHVSGAVLSDLLSSSPAGTDTSSSTTTTSEYAGQCDRIAEDNEEWLAGLDDAAWLPAMQTQRDQRRPRRHNNSNAMSFHPTEYAMRLLREASVSCSIGSDVKYEGALDLLLPQQDREEEQADEGTEKQASSAKLLHELSRQYADELHKQLTHDPALRRYLANKGTKQSASTVCYAMNTSDELQELLLYSLSNRSAPTATKVSQAKENVKAESNDASKRVAEQKGKEMEADKSAAVLRAQEMLVNKLLQSLPPIPPDLQDELGRQRRLLERLLQAQQREEQRRKYEAQEEVRRRVQAPRLDPATALFTEALHSPSNARLGLTKVVEPFTMAQQLQRIAADTTRPLPPLLTLTTASPLTSAPMPTTTTTTTTNGNNNVREDKTQAALSRQLHEMQTSYQSLLAAEQAKRHAERQAFTELLQKQQAQLLQQHRSAIDALRQELRQTKKGQEEQLARLAASKDAAMERRSAVVQAAQTQTMKHMLQGAVEVMKSYTTATPARHSEHTNTKGKGETTGGKDTVSPTPAKTKPRIDAHFRGPVTVQLPEVRQVSTSQSLRGKSHSVRASQLRKVYVSGRSPGTTLRRSTKAQASNAKTKSISKTQQQQGLQTEESHSESRSRFIAQETRSLSDETSTHSDNSARTQLIDVTKEEQRAVGSVTQRPHASRRPSSLSTHGHIAEEVDNTATSVKKKALRSSLTAGRPAVGHTLLFLTPSAPQPSHTTPPSHEDNAQAHEQTSSGVCFGESEATMGCTYGKLWSEYSTALREVQGLQRQLQAEQAASIVPTSSQAHTSSDKDRQRHLSRMQHTEEALLRNLRLPKHEERDSEERHVHDTPTSEPLLRSGPELLTVSSAVAATARSLCAARQRLRRIASVLFRDEDVEGDAVQWSESLQRHVKEGLMNETIHAVIGEAAEQALLSQLQDKLAEELLQHELHTHIQNTANLNDKHTRALRQIEREQNWAATLQAAQTQAAMHINDAELTTALESGLQELIAQALHTKQPQKQTEGNKATVAEVEAKHRRNSVLTVPTLIMPQSVPHKVEDVLSESEHEVVHVPPDPNAAWLLGDKAHETTQVQRHSLPNEGKKEQSVVIEPAVHNTNTASSSAVRTHTMDGAVHILIDVGTLTRNATNNNNSSNAWQPLVSPGTQALPLMQSEQPRRRASDETLHDVIVESVEPRRATVSEQGTGLVVPIPAAIATTQISNHANNVVDALQAQRVREMWQRVHDAVVQDEAQQRWLLSEEEMLQRHTLSALLTRWRTTLTAHNLKETTSLLPRVPQVNESTPLHDTNIYEGQGEAEQESALPPAPPAAAERYIRDPVTRFVFEWLHEFGAREAAQRSRSAAEQSRYFVEQLHYGDELTTTPAQDSTSIIQLQDNNNASAVINNEQANVVSPSPIQSASPFTTTSSSSPSASTYSATHASSLTSHGGHVFASRGNEDLRRRARRYPLSSPSPTPAVSSAYIAERSHRHRPLLRVNNNSIGEESEPTTSTSSESYPVVGVPRRVNGAVTGIDESVTTRYTTLTTTTTSTTSNSDSVAQRPSLVPPSSVTARTANSASMTTETTITTTTSSSASMPRQTGEGFVRHAPLYTTSASSANDNDTTQTTRATTTSTTQTSETSLVDTSSAAAAARRRRLISPLNAEDIEAETDNEGEGNEGRGQHAIESNAPRPGWW